MHGIERCQVGKVVAGHDAPACNDSAANAGENATEDPTRVAATVNLRHRIAAPIGLPLAPGEMAVAATLEFWNRANFKAVPE